MYIWIYLNYDPYSDRPRSPMSRYREGSGYFAGPDMVPFFHKSSGYSPSYIHATHAHKQQCLYVCMQVCSICILHKIACACACAIHSSQLSIYSYSHEDILVHCQKLIRYIVLLVIPIRALSRECTSETTRGVAVSTSSTIIRFRHFENGFESSYHIITAVTHDCFPYKQASSDRKTKALMS